MNSKWIVIFSLLLRGGSAFTVSIHGSKTDVNIDNFEEASIVLNCTYTEDDGERLEEGRSIIWRSHDGRNIAGFSKPGGAEPILYSNGEYLRNRSKLYNPTENSTSALIVIDDVLCEDDKQVFYCYIKYTKNEEPVEEESDYISISLQKSAQQPMDFPLISTTETWENDDLYLSCTADVGKYPGYVKWWRFRSDKSISLISDSDTLSDEAGKCDFVTSANTTYRVTREDNGAFFRCTSHSNITQSQDPEENPLYRDTEKINVIYASKVTNIDLVPNMSIYPVSTPTLRLTCLADGNPPPNNEDFKWTYQNSNSNITEEIGFSSNSLILHNLKESHSGTYFCSVSNSLNSTNSSNVTIIVNGTIPDPPLQVHCLSDPCGALQTCVDTGRGFVCETNGLSVVGVVFIVLTTICVSATIGLFYYVRKLREGLKVAHHGDKYNAHETTNPRTDEDDVSSDVTYAQIKKT